MTKIVHEQTLVLVKPDAMRGGNSLAIQEVYEREGLRILMVYELEFSKKDAEFFYQQHAGESYFDELVSSITDGPCEALLLEGENAIALVQEINGPMDPAKAQSGTIRYDFRSVDGPFRTVYESENKKAFDQEHAQVLEMFCESM